MAWQPTVFMERERDGQVEQVRFNRHEIMQHKADGWHEIGGNDHAVKVVAVVKETAPVVPIVVGNTELTPAQLVALQAQGS